MKFDQYPEPYVNGPTVRAYMGDVSDVTLWRWCQEGCPFHMGRNGRRMYKLSEVEAWMFDQDDQDGYRFKRTDSPADGGDEDVA